MPRTQGARASTDQPALSQLYRLTDIRVHGIRWIPCSRSASRQTGAPIRVSRHRGTSTALGKRSRYSVRSAPRSRSGEVRVNHLGTRYWNQRYFGARAHRRIAWPRPKRAGRERRPAQSCFRRPSNAGEAVDRAFWGWEPPGGAEAGSAIPPELGSDKASYVDLNVKGRLGRQPRLNPVGAPADHRVGRGGRQLDGSSIVNPRSRVSLCRQGSTGWPPRPRTRSCGTRSPPCGGGSRATKPTTAPELRRTTTRRPSSRSTPGSSPSTRRLRAARGRSGGRSRWRLRGRTPSGRSSSATCGSCGGSSRRPARGATSSCGVPGPVTRRRPTTPQGGQPGQRRCGSSWRGPKTSRKVLILHAHHAGTTCAGSCSIRRHSVDADITLFRGVNDSRPGARGVARLAGGGGATPRAGVLLARVVAVVLEQGNGGDLGRISGVVQRLAAPAPVSDTVCIGMRVSLDDDRLAAGLREHSPPSTLPGPAISRHLKNLETWNDARGTGRVASRHPPDGSTHRCASRAGARNARSGPLTTPRSLRGGPTMYAARSTASCGVASR